MVSVRDFLKHVCFDEEKRVLTCKCFNSDVRYTSHDYHDDDYEGQLEIWGIHVSALCENDPHSYQACGLLGNEIGTEDLLCGGYFCDPHYQSFNESSELDVLFKHVECDGNCSNNGECPVVGTEDSEEGGITLCDDICDEGLCRDELDCNGLTYGVTCWSDKKRTPQSYPINNLPPQLVCDGIKNCRHREDEANCEIPEASVETCSHYRNKNRGIQIQVPLTNFTRCSPFVLHIETRLLPPYCEYYRDQTNCSDVARVGGRCLIDGYMSTVSKYVLCDRQNVGDPTNLCDDRLEQACVSPATLCKIHKHKLCNGRYDCLGKSDELIDDCNSQTQSVIANFTCTRSFFPDVSLPLPSSWILDGARDCLDGEDENVTMWSFCGSRDDDSLRVKLVGEPCANVYLCPGEDIPFVKLEKLCDGVESCGMENKVCWIARDFPREIIIRSSVDRVGSVLNLCKYETIDDCVPREFTFGEKFGETSGVENTVMLIIPNHNVSCSDAFGEYYVYLSCMGICSEENAVCPLKHAPLLYDSCPGQFYDRVFALANNSYLTFVRPKESGVGFYRPNYHQCNNGKCIEHDKMCNLVDDCGDGSDEENCINHVVCQNTVSKSKKHLISLEQECDGIYDCFDFSDECNGKCGREIFDGLQLKITCWLMGTLALIFNCVTVTKGLCLMRACDTDMMLLNQALANLIAFGDLLIGIYLVVLSIFDSFIFGKSFCMVQADWLTSTTCAVLGVISTLGSQFSLFAMTVLSFIRASGLIGKELSRPADLDRGAIVKTAAVVCGVVGLSLFVAITPLMPMLEDYFVQGMYYDPEYKLFIGFPDKSRHLNILEAYFNNTHQDNATMDLNTADLTWSEIHSKVDQMFSSQYGRMERKPVHFYGNDGVCLFKYFVRSDDARRSRNTVKSMSDIADHKGNLIVWIMLGLNFTCVIAITICYFLIMVFVKKSSVESGSNQCPHKEKELRLMQNRIAIMIISDFFCWIPFIFTSAAHNLKAIDATQWYLSFAMIALPLNSCINPLIYDNQLRNAITSTVMKILSVARRRRSAVEIHNPAEEIEMEVINRVT